MTLSKRNYFANNNAKKNSFIHSIYMCTNSGSITTLAQRWTVVSCFAFAKLSWPKIGPLSTCHVHTLMPELPASGQRCNILTNPCCQHNVGPT